MASEAASAPHRARRQHQATGIRRTLGVALPRDRATIGAKTPAMQAGTSRRATTWTCSATPRRGSPSRCTTACASSPADR